MILVGLAVVAALGVLALAVHGFRYGRKLAALFPERTTPGDRPVVLFDGDCVFCRKQVDNLKRMLGADHSAVVEWVSFQDPGVLARFPGVSHDACMEALAAVMPDGRVHAGPAGVAVLLGRRTRLAHVYFLPLVRQLVDGGYAVIAANRYRLMGKAVAAGECEGSCALHLRK